MPKLEAQEDPNGLILLINAKVKSRSVSSYAQYWCLAHFNSGTDALDYNHLFRDIENTTSGPPKIDDLNGLIERIGDPVALQIIQRLILHHDDITIDFRTRLAIIFNFRDRVFEADKSLALLDLLHVQGSKAGETEYTKTNQLLRKTIFLLSFSRAVLHGSDNKTLVLRCKDIITDYLEGDGWDSRNTLTCEIIMALGALESSWLLHVLFRVVQKGISAAASESFDQLESTKVARTCLSARNVCAALAWAVDNVIGDPHESSVYDCSEGLFAVIKSESTSNHDLFYLLETIFPLLKRDESLRSKLQISPKLSEELLKDLTDPRSDQRKYLDDAPGYTVTLRLALKIFEADAAILFAWADNDEFALYIKGFETKNEGLQLDQSLTTSLPATLMARARYGAFSESVEAGFLSSKITRRSPAADESMLEVSISQYFGVPVVSNDGIRYFLLFAYEKLRERKDILSSIYCWLWYAPVLGRILHSIQAKYVQSSKTWDLLRTSYKAVHLQEESQQSPRRKLLARASARVPVGRLLNEIATGYSYRPIRFREVVKLLREKSMELQELAMLEGGKDVSRNLLFYQGIWPIDVSEIPAVIPESKKTYVNFPQPLLVFIFHECLHNALTFFATQISVRVGFDGSKISVIVRNDIDAQQRAEHERLRRGANGGTGLKACEQAASVIKGAEFTSVELKDGGFTDGLYRVTSLRLPVFVMPNSLWEFML